MGVHNTKNPRVTIYLKQAHVEFLDEIINGLSRGSDAPPPSRSDLIRVILDKYSKTEDNHKKSLYKEIAKVSKTFKKL